MYANHRFCTTKLTEKKLDSYIKWKARYNDTPVLEEEYHIYNIVKMVKLEESMVTLI